MTAKEAYEELKKIKKRDRELEQIIIDSGDSSIAYYYVCHCLNDIWPEAEHVLATDTYWAVAYATSFLKRPFEIAHPKIFEKSEFNQIMVNKYRHFLDEQNYDYSEWRV